MMSAMPFMDLRKTKKMKNNFKEYAIYVNGTFCGYVETTSELEAVRYVLCEWSIEAIADEEDEE